MRLAIYPGTFDPMTNGHMDLARRALECFDHLVLAVAESSPKNTLFSLEERMAIVEESLAEYDRVEVTSFHGLLVEYAREKKAHVVIRGLRAFSDFEYEFQMALINRKLAPDIETMFLMPSVEYSYISSSRVREISGLGGDISAYVPPAAHEALQKRLKGEETSSSG